MSLSPTSLDAWLPSRFDKKRTERRTSWLREYNHERPHGSLDGLTPVEFFELWEGQEREAA
ncbi:MAG: transposase [Deltaproteobacteria bacterium]|nr:transposase [Deltaproteobacteria bacterium]